MARLCNQEEVCLLRGTSWTIKCSKGRAKSRAVIRQPFIAEALVLFQGSPCENCGGKIWPGNRFPPSTLFSLASIIPPTLKTRLLLHFAVTKRTTDEAWELSKNSALWDVGQK